MGIENAVPIGATRGRWSTADLGCITGLVVLAIICFALVRPSGEFALNDDWAYLLPVKWWHERGRLQFTDWQYMTLVGQVAVGTLVAAVTGFSITSLRWLVIVLAVASVLLVYGTARVTRSTPLAGLLAALLLLCNPIFVITSASFMTDIPFLAACLAAVFVRVTARPRGGTARLVLAWLFVLLACSIRQSGIALALGFIAFDAVQRGAARRAIRSSMLPALVIAVLVAAYPKVVEQTIGLPSMFNQPNAEVKGFLTGLLHLHLGLLWMALKNLLVAFGYLGLCMAPLLPVISRGASPWRRPAVALGIAAGCAITLIALGRAAPVPGNTFFDFGLGVRTLPSNEPARAAPAGFWWAIAFVVGMGAAASLFAAASLRWRRAAANPSPAADGNACVAMLLTILCIYNIPFLMRGGIWFDRYALLNIALFGMLAAPYFELSRRTRAGLMLSTVLLAAFLAFGVAGTHDYLEWNRQRWLAAEELARREGIDSTQIDGGFEYNNYQARLNGDRHRSPESVNLRNPAARYRLSFSPLPGHTLVATRPCDTWLYGSPRAIYVLRTTEPDGP